MEEERENENLNETWESEVDKEKWELKKRQCFHRLGRFFPIGFASKIGESSLLFEV